MLQAKTPRVRRMPSAILAGCDETAFGALMAPDLPLTREQHEMITTRVSVLNRCHY